MTFQTNSQTLMPTKITGYTVLVNCVLISHIFHYRISLRSLSILVSLSFIKLSVRFHYKFQWLHCMFIQHLVHMFWQTHHNITALVDSHALPCQKSFKYAVLMLCQLDQLKQYIKLLLVQHFTPGKMSSNSLSRNMFSQHFVASHVYTWSGSVAHVSIIIKLHKGCTNNSIALQFQVQGWGFVCLPSLCIICTLFV